MPLQVAEKKAGRTVTVKRGASGTDEPHPFGWRDAMDIVVKWRQLSEPNDQALHRWCCADHPDKLA